MTEKDLLSVGFSQTGSAPALRESTLVYQAGGESITVRCKDGLMVAWLDNGRARPPGLWPKTVEKIKATMELMK